MSCDPKGMEGSGLNMLRYVDNNPIKFIDLFGFEKGFPVPIEIKEIDKTGELSKAWRTANQNMINKKNAELGKWRNRHEKLSKIPILRDILTYKYRWIDSLPGVMLEFGKVLEKKGLGTYGVTEMFNPIQMEQNMLRVEKLFSENPFLWKAMKEANDAYTYLLENNKELSLKDINEIFQSNMDDYVRFGIISKEGFAEKEKFATEVAELQLTFDKLYNDKSRLNELFLKMTIEQDSDNFLKYKTEFNKLYEKQKVEYIYQNMKKMNVDNPKSYYDQKKIKQKDYRKARKGEKTSDYIDRRRREGFK